MRHTTFMHPWRRVLALFAICLASTSLPLEERAVERVDQRPDPGRELGLHDLQLGFFGFEVGARSGVAGRDPCWRSAGERSAR